MPNIYRIDTVPREFLGERVYYDGVWWKVIESNHGWLTLARIEKGSWKNLLNTIIRALTRIKKVRPTEVF